ncbi:uncharacterized protein CANTADRAFT_143504 [Suhomyces tanzawaensis NRRL Y-17324]|uniref:Mediator of RNA polymerase II transcription subunit 18 n=1 Tax=Suhomyces tanzawaensis NRRL Y-17324 TaxID=984487 RepID=A0A1E4SSJ1_9ASCO|nr:uncharacterized protein CANTADRAFT_143504 [Suhomyces tanzawaensis NRRL Y-17324]ODV82387.1 hypothetical protein CANTADRAFT_143504 [Suhomyces tanzawaensis NRRL Y-17324]
MVHQLSLVSSIPHSKYIQTVSTLQALTGLANPQDIATYTLITKPHNIFKPKFEPGKVNQIEQYYMKCTTTWSDEASTSFDISAPILKGGDNDDVLADRLFSGDEPVERNWTLQVSDIPIAGKNQLCSAQTIYESTLVHTHTTVKEGPSAPTAPTAPTEPTSEIPQAPTEPEPATEENPASTEVVDLDAMDVDAIEVDHVDLTGEDDKKDTTEVKEEDKKETQVPEVATKNAKKDSFLQFIEDLGYDLINQYWVKGIRFFHKDIVIEIFKVFVRDDTTESSHPGRIKLKLLDESNNFQIKAYINIPKSTDVELINQGNKDLLKIQEFLKNLFELQIPDRMFMDSRVKQ